MIPSMPRFSTPARSHSSTPSVPRISGVAMRSTATQKGRLKSSSKVSASMGGAAPKTMRYCAAIVATSIDSSDTETMTSAM